MNNFDPLLIRPSLDTAKLGLRVLQTKFARVGLLRKKLTYFPFAHFAYFEREERVHSEFPHQFESIPFIFSNVTSRRLHVLSVQKTQMHRKGSKW